MVERIIPKITLPDGSSYAPKGWEWVLGFASKGVEWAVTEAIRPRFRERALKDYEGDEKSQQVIEQTLREVQCKADEMGIVFVPDQWDRLLAPDFDV